MQTPPDGSPPTFELRYRSTVHATRVAGQFEQQHDPVELSNSRVMLVGPIALAAVSVVVVGALPDRGRTACSSWSSPPSP